MHRSIIWTFLLFTFACTPRDRPTPKQELSKESQALSLNLTAKDFVADMVEEIGSEKSDAELKVSVERVLRKHETTITNLFAPRGVNYGIQDLLNEMGLKDAAGYLPIKGGKTIQQLLEQDLSIKNIIKNPKLGMTRFQILVADFILTLRRLFEKLGFNFGAKKIDHSIFKAIAKRSPQIRTTLQNQMAYIRNLDNLSSKMSVKKEIFGMFDAKLIPESTLDTLEKFSVGYFQYLPESEKIRVAASFLRADRLQDKFDYMEIALRNSGPTLQKVFQFIGDYIPKNLEKEKARLLAEGLSEDVVSERIQAVEKLRGVMGRVKSDKMYSFGGHSNDIIRLLTSTGSTSYTETQARELLTNHTPDDVIRIISEDQKNNNKINRKTVDQIKTIAQKTANDETKVFIGQSILGTQNKTYDTIEEADKARIESINAYNSAFNGDPILIGQASIGRTASVLTQDGSRVVIKIKRPGADKSFQNEMVGFEKSFPANESSAETQRRFMQKITDDVNVELDFTNESKNFLVVDKIYKNQAKSGRFSVTDLMAFNSRTKKFEKVNAVENIPSQNSSLIVMSRAQGQEINNFDGKDYTNSKGETFTGAEVIELRKQAVNELYQTWLKESLFKGGDFHADLHSGNIFFDLEKENGKSKFVLTLIDYGAMGQLSSDLQTHAKIFGLGLRNNDIRLIVTGLLNISEDPMSDADLDILTDDIQKAMDNKNLTPIARQEEILRAVGARNIQVPSGFLQFFRGSSFLEKELNNINEIIQDKNNNFNNIKPVQIADIHTKVGLSRESLNVNNLKSLIGPAAASGARWLKSLVQKEKSSDLKQSLQTIRNDVYKNRIDSGKESDATRTRFDNFLKHTSSRR